MKQKILAIDDSLTLREFIQRCLARQSADYQIVLAKDGTELRSLGIGDGVDAVFRLSPETAYSRRAHA